MLAAREDIAVALVSSDGHEESCSRRRHTSQKAFAEHPPSTVFFYVVLDGSAVYDVQSWLVKEQKALPSSEVILSSYV